MENSRNLPPLNKTIIESVAAYQRALEEILARVVISAGSRLAVAYSGGLDSSVLLRLTQTYCAGHGIELFAFHIHHGISVNADAWMAHCQSQAASIGVQFAAERVTLNDVDQHGTEQAARIARYEALSRLCHQQQVSLLLTAHHQDDQAETVLLQLLRGAGLPGLSAMASLHLQHDLLGGQLALGRPLLNFSRTQLETLAQEWNLASITDESNTDTRFRRNAVRQLVTPILEQHFPGFAARVTRSSQHIQAAQRLLDELAATDLRVCAQGNAIKLDQLTLLSADRIDNLLRYWLQQLHINAPSTAQLAQLRNQMLFACSQSHPLIKLSGVEFERKAGLLIASRSALSGEPPNTAISLQWRGESEITVLEWRGSLILEESDGPGLDKVMLLQGPLRLRCRSGSEKLKLNAARPSRSLKNLFQEARVPTRERRWLPLLYVGEELVFVAGLGMDVGLGWVAQGGITVRWKLSLVD